MEIRDRQRIRRPVPPGMLRDTYRAFSLSNVMLNPPPWHLPRRHFLPQNFPDVELRRSLATSDAEDNPGYGLYLLSYVPLGGIISLYAKDIISVEKAEELKARGNRHIRIVRAAGLCLDSEPRLGRDYDYYTAWRARHELASFANSSNFPNAYFYDVGSYTILVAF